MKKLLKVLKLGVKCRNERRLQNHPEKRSSSRNESSVWRERFRHVKAHFAQLMMSSFRNTQVLLCVSQLFPEGK